MDHTLGVLLPHLSEVEIEQVEVTAGSVLVDARRGLRHPATAPGNLPGGDLVFLRIEAIDDHGRSCNDWGGARGISEDGTRTQGTITGQPALTPDAREITVRFVLL